MTSRERIIAALTHREADRVPILEEACPSTIERWRGEGLPADVPFDRALGIDEFVAFGMDVSFGLPVRTIEETPAHVLRWDANGALVQERRDGTATPHVLQVTLDTRERWAEHRERLAFRPDRMDWDHATALTRDAHARGQFVHYNMPLGYERWAGVLGPQALLVALADDPAWVRELHEADVALHLAAAEELLGRGIAFDAARFSADMGYCGGPLFSPRTYREVFAPGFTRLCGFFHARGIFCVLHTCGNVRSLIPEFIATGFDCLNPLEVKAGMDLLALKHEFGAALCLMGGIDAPGMGRPPEVVEGEIREKLTVARRGGGYIFHSDHAVPETVSLEQYRHVVRLACHYGRQTEPPPR